MTSGRKRTGLSRNGVTDKSKQKRAETSRCYRRAAAVYRRAELLQTTTLKRTLHRMAFCAGRSDTRAGARSRSNPAESRREQSAERMAA